MPPRLPVLCALGAAVLFGASTPFAKLLAVSVNPVLLAGLLYLGSGTGLLVLRTVRDRGFAPVHLVAGDWAWLAGTILAGGVIAPVLLLLGLARASAADASLLLNLEAVFTAVIAWVVLREATERRVVLGMALIVAGGVVLALPGPGGTHGATRGGLAVVGACLCWAIDNNLTRRISAADALFIAAAKGSVAGLTNLLLALALGAWLPSLAVGLGAMALGFLGYGISLVLFVLALRGLGAARTGAYFSTAPFIGALVALLFFGETAAASLWVAAALMAAGVWLHLSEHHEHEHVHEPLIHTHSHTHDSHHQHRHEGGWSGAEPHAHEHRHAPLRHRHPHFPDLHHRHRH